MAEIFLVALLSLGCAASIFAFGVWLGWMLFGRRKETPVPPGDWPSDAAAAARALQRLVEQGAIEEPLHARLMELFGREAVGRTELSASATAQADSSASPFAQGTSPEIAAAANLSAADVVPPSFTTEPLSLEATEEVFVAEMLAEPPTRPAPVPRVAADSAGAMPSAPPVPRTPRRALADVLQAFLEEKNIWWGELISGVLIVGCSIALVISLRREIEDLSEQFVYLPALLFMLTTAAIHAAGNYTLRRWNLQATSRGVLIIATLLIPINFLAAILVTRGEARQLPLLHPLSLLAFAIGLAAFGTMSYFAGKALLGQGWWRLWVAVMGPSAGQLIINRWTDQPQQPWSVMFPLAVPLAAFVLATISQLRLLARRRLKDSVSRETEGAAAALTPQERRAKRTEFVAHETLLLLGVAVFSLAAAIGLLLSRADSLRTALSWLSTPLSLPAVVVLATGLLLQRRLRARNVAGLRTVGTALAVLGAFLMLASVGLAWPQPALLIAVGLFGFVALTTLAEIGRLPVLHQAALASGTLAYLAAFHWWRDAFAGHAHRLSQRFVDLFLTGPSSLALTVLALLVLGAAGVFAQRRRWAVSRSYLMGSVGIAGVSLASALLVGFAGQPHQQPDLATPVLLLYAVVVLIGAYFHPAKNVTRAGSGLLLLAFVHALTRNETIRPSLASWSLFPRQTLLTALLSHGLVTASIAAWLAIRGTKGFAVASGLPEEQSTEGASCSAFALRDESASARRRREMVLPLAETALCASVVAIPLTLGLVRENFGEHACYLVALSVTWFLAAVVAQSPLRFLIFQLLATAAVIFAAVSFSQRQEWWTGDLWLPQHLQVQFSTLAVWCLIWSAVRRWLQRRSSSNLAWLERSQFRFDEALISGTLLALLLTGLAACLPAAAIELSITSVVAPATAWCAAVFELGSWVALLLIAAALLASLATRFSWLTFTSLLLAPAAGALLLAGQFEQSQAVASALRWLFAGYGAVLAGVLCSSRRLAPRLPRLSWLAWRDVPGRLDEWTRSWSLIFGAVPVLGLTTASLVQAASGISPGGPSAASFFGQMGPELSFGVPLALLAGTLIAHAVREKNSGFMLAGSAVFQYLVNLAYFLPLLTTSTTVLGWSERVGCLRWNTLGAAIYALAWLGVRGWLARRAEPQEQPDHPLRVQMAAVGSLVFVVALLATAAVVATPGDLSAFVSLGQWLTYVAVLLGLAALGWYLGPQALASPSTLLPLAAVSLAAVAGLVAISIEQAAGSWWGYHTLMIAWTAAAALTAAPLLRPGRPVAHAIGGVRLPLAFIVVVVLLALRAVPIDPQTPWWSLAATLIAAVLTSVCGVSVRRQGYAYGSGLLAALAVSMLWWGAWTRTGPQGFFDLLQLNLVALVLAALGWLVVELRSQFRHGRTLDPLFSGAAFHRATGVSACIGFVGILGAGFGLTSVLDVPRRNLDISTWLGVGLSGLLGLLLAGTLWDRYARLTLPALYAWGLACALMGLDQIDQLQNLDSQSIVVLTGLLIASYVALTGHLWSFGANLAALGRRLAMPHPVRHLKRTSRWLPAVSLSLAVLVVAVEFVVVLIYRERWMRVAAAMAPLLLAYGVACQAQQQRRSLLQFVSLMLASLAAVFASWADIEPGFRSTFVLERAVRLLMVLAGLSLLYAWPLSRWARQRGGDWFAVIRRAATTCGSAALVTLAGVLLLELAYFEPGRGVPFGHPYQVIAVAVTLVGLIATFLSFALAPRHDPLALSERGRMGYVYAAQIVAALLFTHLYLSNPSLFGAFRAYWPYIVMGIAFAAVGVGELFQRSGVAVLADPLQRTGSFLPLLPALGWWLSGSLGIETAGHYALLLFLAGLLYALVSMLRRSYLSAAVAALAGNAALWAVLADFEPLTLLRHPQFWLIPPAVSALIAAQLNRGRLSETQLTAVRYLSLLVIYVSSTADIVIGGVGDTLWEPMLLALLSVLGVFLGIGLRVRAFLYLGATFVFLSVVSMVWHAYAHIQHVGIWWAFGIALGLLILTFFGLFEKHRPQLTRLVENLQTWGR